MAFDASDKQILKQGYIEKRGAELLSAWKKRYIVLYKNNSIIEYYTDDSKKQLKGKINILPYNLAKKYNPKEAVHSNLNNVKYGFDIECKNRTWKFRCKNDKIKQDWIDAIRKCIKAATCNNCRDIYHCCFELQVKSDEWIIVWPLLKLDKNNSNYDDEQKSDANKSDDCDINDKILYLFDIKKDRDEEKVNKSIKTLRIAAGFDDIYEHFPFNNKNKDDINCCTLNLSQNEEYVFKCKNAKQRQLFIDAICETVYYQDDYDTTKMYNTDDLQFKFKYKPIYQHIKNDNQQDLNKWFHVPISIPKYNHRFVLSIERNSSFTITMSNLSTMVNFMIKDYFEMKKIVECRFYGNCHEMQKIVIKYSKSGGSVTVITPPHLYCTELTAMKKRKTM